MIFELLYTFYGKTINWTELNFRHRESLTVNSVHFLFSVHILKLVEFNIFVLQVNLTLFILLVCTANLLFDSRNNWIELHNVKTGAAEEYSIAR